MGELTPNGAGFQTSGMNQNFDQSPAYQGSWQQILRNNEGQYCIIDFLIGTQNLVQKEGILYDVGVSFIVLFEPRSRQYIVCDLYSVKFVTFIAEKAAQTLKSTKRKI